MARLTEIEDEPDAGQPLSQRKSSVKGSEKGKPPTLTQAEREQVLYESGVLDKLGLPKDFITLEEAQATLGAQRTSGTHRSNSDYRAQENARRVAKQRGNDRVTNLDSEDELYGNASDLDYEDDEDTAERLLQEQVANEMNPRLESILDLLIWTMPFGFLYTLLDILVRQQYGETVGFADEAKRLSGSLPVLALFIHYNLTSRRKIFLQAVLFATSVACGCSLIYIVNKSTYDVVVQRVAPLGTLWIFAIVRLDLLPACVGLGFVAAFVQKADMKIIFD